MSVLESRLEARFRDKVKELGGLAIKVLPAVAGYPDRLVVWPGGQIEFVELKREGEKPRPVQIEMHRKLRARQATVSVLAGREEIDAWLADRQMLYESKEPDR